MSPRPSFTQATPSMPCRRSRASTRPLLVCAGRSICVVSPEATIFEPHPIREAVDLAIQQCKHALEHHTVQIAIPETLPPVKMDLERITEVLAQLLDNAGKYSPPDTPIHITANLNDGQLLTSVADHGPGIDDYEQSMIFEKFYRGRDQRLSIQGTGMGLAIAKAIVELHGGTIGVTSQVGRGSVFYFSLPLAS